MNTDTPAEVIAALRKLAAEACTAAENASLVCQCLQSQVDLLLADQAFNVYAARVHADHHSCALREAREAALFMRAADLLEGACSAD